MPPAGVKVTPVAVVEAAAERVSPTRVIGVSVILTPLTTSVISKVIFDINE
jgi:hypothetical protein